MDSTALTERKPHMKAINQGTNRSPAHLKMYKNAARNGPPRAKPSAHPLRRSATKRAGVVLLNPCFSSKTKVWYIDSGRVGIDEQKNKIATKAIDWIICRRASESSGLRE